MYKFLLLFGMILSFTCLKSQVKDTIPDSTKVIQVQDSLKKKAEQDTVKKETRAERKARIKAEKEREKFYYKDIRKDSARLAIERLSRIAWKRSLILPGWGQYTNGGLWWVKVPIIYGGFVAGGLTFNYWQWYYKEFLTELQYRENYGQPSNHESLGLGSSWTVQGLVQQKDYGRRNRDLTVLVTLGWYGLNVVEAYVDSILKNRWNISNDLSFKVSPTLLPNYAYTPGMGSFAGSGFVSPGLKMTFTLK
ncbi:hypothetical protein CHU00_10550 [Sphingobacterium cellulitidis]|uniref:DUF5683 domain-containing protein n=1 Tax=Sphingobacterium cellulitidis TaxID=1768011 RepID=UPI000B93F750|nr:DUF5683 domain-containing protein [Sphingobacterium cellulitidis]OYD45773.1 hypothetical protein CHU00_10550 [Sphingobacterium cellulitidis]